MSYCNVFEQLTLNGQGQELIGVFHVCVLMLDKEVGILFRPISKTLQGDWDWSGCNLQLLLLINLCDGSQNAKRIIDTICLLFAYTRVLYLSFKDDSDWALCTAMFLSRIAIYYMKQSPAELHIRAGTLMILWMA